MKCFTHDTGFIFYILVRVTLSYLFLTLNNSNKVQFFVHPRLIYTYVSFLTMLILCENIYPQSCFYCIPNLPPRTLNYLLLHRSIVAFHNFSQINLYILLSNKLVAQYFLQLIIVFSFKCLFLLGLNAKVWSMIISYTSELIIFIY